MAYRLSLATKGPRLSRGIVTQSLVFLPVSRPILSLVYVPANCPNAAVSGRSQASLAPFVRFAVSATAGPDPKPK